MDEKNWWLQSLRAPLGLALLSGGCADLAEETRPDAPIAQSADEYDHSVQALELQRAEGWDVGGVDRPLVLGGASVFDAYGMQGWRSELNDLHARLSPSREALLPYYVPTLFQSLIGPGGERLRAQVQPIHTRMMEDDFARGLALRELFEQAGWPRDTAVVVDAPGPRAVAIAAALADRFDPVFTFGNWPHPLGVVPAQDTLAAALFYLPVFERSRQVRQNDAPPVFVLDENRLLPYRDADTEFDNRYLAHLPGAAQLSALGIRHLLYVDADGRPELDDLNGELVDLCAAGIDVRTAALSDFQRGPELETRSDEEEDDDSSTVALSFAVDWFWYGGLPEWHVTFWEDYGWYRPERVVWVGPPHGRRGITVGPPRGVRPIMTQAHRSSPLPRATMFGGYRARPLPPPGFGRVEVRSARADGKILAVRPGSYQPRGLSSLGRVTHSAPSLPWSHWNNSFRSGSLGRVGGGGVSA